MNPKGMFHDGLRLRFHASRDLLPMSGRRIPQFANRRTIRDFFSRSLSGECARRVAGGRELIDN